MGWAARAKVRAGNPVTQQSREVMVLGRREHRKAFAKRGAAPLQPARFHDRAYLVDEQGTMRRAPVTRTELVEARCSSEV